MADADISSFVGITGTSAAVARGFLELTNGDYEQAVQLFFDNPDLQHSIGSSATQPPRPSADRISSRVRGHSDDEGVVHLDSDDDDDDLDDDDARIAERNARAEADAEAARRLQEEEYAAFPADAEGVRSPIRGTTETLVDPVWPGGAADIGIPNPLARPPPQPLRRG